MLKVYFLSKNSILKKSNWNFCAKIQSQFAQKIWTHFFAFFESFSINWIFGQKIDLWYYAHCGKIQLFIKKFNLWIVSFLASKFKFIKNSMKKKIESLDKSLDFATVWAMYAQVGLRTSWCSIKPSNWLSCFGFFVCKETSCIRPPIFKYAPWLFFSCLEGWIFVMTIDHQNHSV